METKARATAKLAPLPATPPAVLDPPADTASAAQAALSTVSQNLSNLQTPGYTRQGVLLGA